MTRPYDHERDPYGVPPALVERVKGGPPRLFPLTIAEACEIADALEDVAQRRVDGAGHWAAPFDLDDERTVGEREEDELVDLAIAAGLVELAQRIRRWTFEVAGQPVDDEPASWRWWERILWRLAR